MKRIIKVLVVSALMVVMMATTAVSPALAQPEGEGRGYGPDPGYKWCGAEKCGGHVFGAAHGSDQNCSYYENPRRSDDC